MLLWGGHSNQPQVAKLCSMLVRDWKNKMSERAEISEIIFISNFENENNEKFQFTMEVVLTDVQIWF